MTRCIETQEPFVIALIKNGQEALGCLAEPFAIGTTAIIREVEYLEGGKLNIVATGLERVRILRSCGDLAYLCGETEILPYPVEDIAPGAQTLRAKVKEFVDSLAKTGKMPRIVLPEDDHDLIFFCASILPVTCRVRQSFLETEKLSDLSRELVSHFSRQIALIQAVGDGKAKDPYLN